MVFSSDTFLFFFLPAVLLVYFVVPRSARNLVLLLFSLAFYVWGAGWIVFILVGSILVNYELGLRIEREMEAGRRPRAKLILGAAVVLNAGLLAWFKYANFGVGSWNGLLASLGFTPMPWAPVLLPIGISFYTFHSLSYLIDVFRGVARHLESRIDFALYITFFPQLVAGPIVRFHEIRDQIVRRRETIDAFSAGVYRFSLGMGKKVLIADTIAPVANATFSTPAGELHTWAAVLGVVTYAVQLYFDFSGYSDMALGLAQMFGLRLPENFNRPYASRSVTEFWRRWHMSLSRWFRDYLYIPLGGKRGSPLLTYRNLVIVFLATGLWHGANWTFVLWGAYHGVLLLVERALGIGRSESRGADRIGQVRTIFLVLFGWILFRSASIGDAFGYIVALARPGLQLPPDIALALGPPVILALALGVASVLLPRDWVTGVRLEYPTTRRIRLLRLAMAGVVLPAALVLVLAGSFSPFLYFQF